MKTRKAKGKEKRPPTPKERAKRLGDRIFQAVVFSGRKTVDVAAAVGVSEKTFQAWMGGRSVPFLHEQVAIAAACGVDARWLATGKTSAAGKAALAEVKRVHPLHPYSKLFLALEVLVQPILEHGRCRYCACTYYEPCAEGCQWVCHDETICSACLDPESQLDQEED